MGVILKDMKRMASGFSPAATANKIMQSLSLYKDAYGSYYVHQLIKEKSNPYKKYKTRGKMGRPTLSEKIEVVHKVICGHHTHEYVAREIKLS